MTPSFTTLVHQDMIHLKKASDYIVDPARSYAISLDISRCGSGASLTVPQLDQLVLDLFQDHQRRPTAVYYCSSTLILFFKAMVSSVLISDPGQSASHVPHLFGGSHQKIIAWFSGLVNLLLKVSHRSQLVLTVLTEFHTSLQMTEYFVWAASIHERSILTQTVLMSHPTLDCREFTFQEFESSIPADTWNDIDWQRHRYGRLYHYDTTLETLIHHDGPFRGDQVSVYHGYFH